MQGRLWATVEKRKPLIILVSLILLLFICFSVIGSLGQILSVRDDYSGNQGSSLNSENPVYSPLLRASSHFHSSELSPGIHVIYDGNNIGHQSLSWDAGSKPEWWIPSDQESPAESVQLPENRNGSNSGKLGPQDPMPRLRSGNFDAQARAGDFISSGVADLLNMLREKDLKRSLDKDSSTTNPFEEALTTASNDEAPAKAKQTSSPDSAAKQVQKTADNPSSSGGDPAKTNGIFLFIGNFADQQVAATTATAQDLIVPSNSSAATFDLAGFGKQSFDLNIILRNPDNQESIAVGDLNGDGFPDLVITSRVNNRAFVYINDGQGNYVLKSDIYGGFGPAAAAIANFGGDGSPDIAVMLADDKKIVVDGNGLRKFIFLPTSSIDRVYSSIMPYDFDGDGVNDLLLTNYSDLTVSVYLNQKDATFVESTVLPLQSFPFLQSKADLNGDGIDDVVYVQHVGDQISIVVVNGKDGSISSLANTMLDPSIYYVLGDFNQDGVIDIAIAHRR